MVKSKIFFIYNILCELLHPNKVARKYNIFFNLIKVHEESLFIRRGGNRTGRVRLDQVNSGLGQN